MAHVEAPSTLDLVVDSASGGSREEDLGSY